MESFRVFLENTAGLHGLLLDLVENTYKADLWLMAADAFEDINETLLAKYFRLTGDMLNVSQDNSISLGLKLSRYDKDELIRKEPLRQLTYRKFDGYSVDNSMSSLRSLPAENNIMYQNITIAGENIFSFANNRWFIRQNGDWVDIEKTKVPFGVVLVCLIKVSQ